MRLYHGAVAKGIDDPRELIADEIKAGTYLTDNRRYAIDYTQYKTSYAGGKRYLITVDVSEKDVKLYGEGGSFYGTWYILVRKPKGKIVIEELS